jgi:signal peptidase I
MAEPSVPDGSPQATVPVPRGHLSRRTSRLLATWLLDLAIGLGIAAIIIVFLYQPMKVEGTSMAPLLDDQERIFINKLVYRLEAISPGDVVVFHYPRDPSLSYIKRVIAVPGDTVRIDNGQVFVNGKQLVEDYVSFGSSDDYSFPEIVVPPHYFFVLGDHRNMSQDSRKFGPVHERFIYGKAVFGYWPVEKMGRVK